MGEGGRMYCWGYGGHGNLGGGDRRDKQAPEGVGGEGGSEFEREAACVVAVACTRGQEGTKGGLYPKVGGTEGPHTLCVTASGRMYSFGAVSMTITTLNPTRQHPLPPPPPPSQAPATKGCLQTWPLKQGRSASLGTSFPPTS
jgi:hypothetical protein